MLPMWKTYDEVRAFLSAVDGRAKTTLLLETAEAVDCIDDILTLDFDEIHIGLNDLHLSRGLSFMFEPLADGTVEMLGEKFRKKGIPWGFGGVAHLGDGLLPAENILMEHYRLGSTRVILSRSFCDAEKFDDTAELAAALEKSMHELRTYEKICAAADEKQLADNRAAVHERVAAIAAALREKKKP